MNNWREQGEERIKTKQEEMKKEVREWEVGEVGSVPVDSPDALGCPKTQRFQASKPICSQLCKGLWQTYLGSSSASCEWGLLQEMVASVGNWNSDFPQFHPCSSMLYMWIFTFMFFFHPLNLLFQGGWATKPRRSSEAGSP